MTKNKSFADQKVKTAKSKQKTEEKEPPQKLAVDMNRQGITAAPTNAVDNHGNGVMSRQPSSILSHEPSQFLQRQPSVGNREIVDDRPRLRTGGRTFADFAVQPGTPPPIQLRAPWRGQPPVQRQGEDELRETALQAAKESSAKREAQEEERTVDDLRENALRSAKEASAKREAQEESRTLAQKPPDEDSLREQALRVAQESSARREELEESRALAQRPPNENLAREDALRIAQESGAKREQSEEEKGKEEWKALRSLDTSRRPLANALDRDRAAWIEMSRKLDQMVSAVSKKAKLLEIEAAFGKRKDRITSEKQSLDEVKVKAKELRDRILAPINYLEEGVTVQSIIGKYQPLLDEGRRVHQSYLSRMKTIDTHIIWLEETNKLEKPLPKYLYDTNLALTTEEDTWAKTNWQASPNGGGGERVGSWNNVFHLTHAGGKGNSIWWVLDEGKVKVVGCAKHVGKDNNHYTFHTTAKGFPSSYKRK